VIIPAAGLSRRMEGFLKRKPFILLGGRPVIAHALDVLRKLGGVKEIILVVNKKDLKATGAHFGGRRVKIIEGASTRSGSVYNGIKVLNPGCDIVLIHDAVRPFVTADMAQRCIRAAGRFGAAVCAVPVVPTIKSADSHGFVASTSDRSRLWEVQTPQAFKRDLIIKAFKNAGRLNSSITDDAMLVERMGRKVKLVMGSYRNIKITTPNDIKIAEGILRCE